MLKNGYIRFYEKVLSGSYTEICRGIHSEQKLIIKFALNGINVSGGIIYLAHSPCCMCAKCFWKLGIVQFIILLIIQV